MHKSTRLLSAAAILLASAVVVYAGGLFVMLGNPDASPEARALKAVLTLKLAGCHEPEKAAVEATAIGTVDGRRKSIPVKLIALSTPGMYAVTQQWPAEGRWVLQFVAKDDGRLTSTLVAAGPGGIERSGAKMAMAAPSQADIAALLAGSPASEVARK